MPSKFTGVALITVSLARKKRAFGSPAKSAGGTATSTAPLLLATNPSKSEIPLVNPFYKSEDHSNAQGVPGSMPVAFNTPFEDQDITIFPAFATATNTDNATTHPNFFFIETTPYFLFKTHPGPCDRTAEPIQRTTGPL
jgi:hypothetical protein